MRHVLRVTVVCVMLGGALEAQATVKLSLFVNPDLTAYIQNTGDEVAKWDGYQITSEGGHLDPVAWHSFQDQIAADPGGIIAKYGAGALGMGEVPGVSAQLLAELNGAGTVDLPVGDKVPIGRPFDVPAGTCAEFEFQYHTTAVVGIPDVDGRFTVCVPIPEPSTWSLAVLGAVGLAAMARRRRAS